MNEITFVIQGQPVPKGRPRFGKHAYTPKRTREYENLVRETGIDHLAKWQSQYGGWGTQNRYGVSLWFFRKAQKKNPLLELHPCDLDNLIKSVTDALNGLFYEDDRQIDELYGLRMPSDGRPRVVVNIRILEEP